MNVQTTPCESCGMPIEAGPYCQHCVDEQGKLQTFAERLARLSQWMRRTHECLSEAEAKSQALAYMATMPAWRDHPELRHHQTQ